MAPALNKRFSWCMGKSSSCRLLNLTWISMVHLTFVLIFRFSGSNSRKNKTTSLRRQTLKFELLKYFTQDVYTPKDHLILLSRMSVQLVLSRILVSFLISLRFQKGLVFLFAHMRWLHLTETSTSCFSLFPTPALYVLFIYSINLFVNSLLLSKQLIYLGRRG